MANTLIEQVENIARLTKELSEEKKKLAEAPERTWETENMILHQPAGSLITMWRLKGRHIRGWTETMG